MVSYVYFYISLRINFLVNYKRKFKTGYDQHRNLAEKKNVEEGFGNKRNQFRPLVEVYIPNFVVIKCNSYLSCTPALVFPRPLKMFAFLFLINALGLL